MITASLINERLSAQCQVTVKELKINSIRMVYPVVQLNGVNDSEQLDIIVDSENASEEVVWISDNEHIAKVDHNGRVTAVGVGTTRIKAVSASTTDLKEELQIKAVCEIRVKNPLVSIGFDKNVVDIKKNQSAQIRVTYNPTDTTDDKSVSWVVYDDSVLSIATSGVNNEIAVITGKDAGTTLIEAIVNNVRTWCTVTVTLTPTGISLSSTSVEIEEGDGAYLEAYVTPQNVITKITWKSSNTSVASVSNEGEIYAQRVGTTVISALTDNGLSASCTVTVKKATRDIVNVTSLQNFQSAHPYKNNSDIMWVYNSPGASVIKLTFSVDTQFEGSYDCLKVYDQNNSLLKKYRERELAGKTISIAGQMVKLRLITHNNVNKYGFKVNAVNAGYDLSKAVISNISNQSYTGVALTPSINVKIGNVTLTKGKDYQVQYVNNVNTGSAQVKVTGIGSSTGSIVKSFAIVLPNLKKPSGLKTKSANTNSAVITWTRQCNVSGYYVYEYKTKKKQYVLVSTLKSSAKNTYTIKKLSAKTKVKYAIKSYLTNNKKTSVSPFAYIETTAAPKTPSVKLKAAKKAVQVEWGKVQYASGYEIYISAQESKGYKKVKTITSAKTVKATINKQKSKKNVYVKMRSYVKTKNGNIYSSYSKPKKIKIK